MLNVEIFNPQVLLKPFEKSKEALVIDLGHISVKNHRYKSKERVRDQSLEDGVWVDNFRIAIKDLCIFVSKAGVAEHSEVTLPFDFNVSVEMFRMAPQYNLIYPDIEFDTQVKIRTYMGPMII